MGLGNLFGQKRYGLVFGGGGVRGGAHVGAWKVLHAAGYKPEIPNIETHGYQPQATVALNPLELTPPKGDTAVQPPQAPPQQQPPPPGVHKK